MKTINLLHGSPLKFNKFSIEKGLNLFNKETLYQGIGIYSIDSINKKWFDNSNYKYIYSFTAECHDFTDRKYIKKYLMFVLNDIKKSHNLNLIPFVDINYLIADVLEFGEVEKLQELKLMLDSNEKFYQFLEDKNIGDIDDIIDMSIAKFLQIRNYKYNSKGYDIPVVVLKSNVEDIKINLV